MATEEWRLLRWGAVAGIVGSVGGVAVNAVHPRVGAGELDDITALLDKVASSGAWRLVHAAAIVTVLLGLVAIGAVLRAMSLEGSNRWVLVTLVSTAITAPLLLLSLSVDGFAIPSIADRWAGASAADQGSLLTTAQAVRDVDIAILDIAMLGHFGVTALFVGAATWSSPSYGPRVAALALAGGVTGVACGLLQAASGDLTALSYLWLLSVSALLLTLWVLWASVLLLRQVPARAPVP